MKRIKLFLLMVLVGLLCCACVDEKTQTKTVSSLYETESLMSVTVSDVEFQIPTSWDSGKKESSEWTYYYHDDLMLAVNVVDEKEHTNEELIAEKEAFVEGMMSSDGTTELLSSDVIMISGADALEVSIAQKASEKLYHMNTVTFIYNAKQYSFCWIVEAESNIDYSEDYIALKESIVFKEVEVAKATLSKEYTIGNNTIKFYWDEISGEEDLSVIAVAEDVEYGSLIFLGLVDAINAFENDILYYSVDVRGGDKYVMLIVNKYASHIYGYNNDGSYTEAMPDWIITEAEGYTLSDVEILSVISEVSRITEEFIETSISEGVISVKP